MTYTVYALFDVREPETIRYVGFSTNPENRLRAHIKEARHSRQKSYRLSWLRKLAKESIEPSLRALAVVQTAEEAARIEIALIANHPSTWRLVNGTIGGEGTDSYTRRLLFKQIPSEEALRNLRAAMQCPETRRKMAAINLGRKHSAEIRAKWGQRNRQRWARGITPEYRAKLSAAIKRWWADRKQNHSGELALSCQKLSASKKGRKTPWSEETRAIVRAKRAMLHRSPELKARQSAYKKTWWADHKAEAKR